MIVILAYVTVLSSLAGEGTQVLIKSGNLRVVVADNAAYGTHHRQGYSGISELYHGSSKRNLFVPAYAGLNFEHIFSGDSTSYDWSIFEPRIAPIKLRRLEERKVELFQKRTANWPLQSRLIYEHTGENIVEMRARFRPLKDVWDKHGYIGVFFASYIDAPEDMAIHFIGRSRPGKGKAAPRWISHLPRTHGDRASHRPAGSTWDPPTDPGFNIALVEGVSEYEYLYPFYYGISRGKVFIMMFKDVENGGELRFAQSPSGGGNGNPAWDFIFLARHYEIGKDIGFTAAAVYTDFKGREDVIRTWEKWSGRKVTRPFGDPDDHR
jgi:hypothetical protein